MLRRLSAWIDWLLVAGIVAGWIYYFVVIYPVRRDEAREAASHLTVPSRSKD